VQNIRDNDLLDRFHSIYYGAIFVFLGRIVGFFDPNNIIRAWGVIPVVLHPENLRLFSLVDLEYPPPNYGKIIRSAQNKQTFFGALGQRVL